MLKGIQFLVVLLGATLAFPAHAQITPHGAKQTAFLGHVPQGVALQQNVALVFTGTKAEGEIIPLKSLRENALGEFSLCDTRGHIHQVSSSTDTLVILQKDKPAKVYLQQEQAWRWATETQSQCSLPRVHVIAFSLSGTKAMMLNDYSVQKDYLIKDRIRSAETAILKDHDLEKETLVLLSRSVPLAPRF